MSVSSLKINQGLGRRDILDRPRGDGKDGLCVTSFYGGNHLNSLKIRPTRKHFFFNCFDFVLTPSSILQWLDVLGNGTVRVSCGTNQIELYEMTREPLSRAFLWSGW